jgi:hypothetical protein
VNSEEGGHNFQRRVNLHHIRFGGRKNYVNFQAEENTSAVSPRFTAIRIMKLRSYEFLQDRQRTNV